MVEGWHYYNHAMLPDCAPHEVAETSCITDGSIWKDVRGGGALLLARWTTDWDCGYDTDWWYVIKDAPYSFDDLAPAQRKHIRQALKRCDVRVIDPEEYLSDLYRVFKEAVAKYEGYRDSTTFELFSVGLCNLPSNSKCWGAFRSEDNRLIGYMTVYEHEEYAAISVAKFSSQFLKDGPSDALYHTVLTYYLNERSLKYISSGERSISHITNTQEYKIHKFAYRKCYCKLHITFHPKYKAVISILYWFKSFFALFDNIHIFHLVNSVLKMEEIVRKEQKHEHLAD